MRAIMLITVFWSLCADAVSVRYETEQVLGASAGEQ